MIANDLIQAANIARGKAATTITTALGSAYQIKEAQWQGKDFIYPALRLAVGVQSRNRAAPKCAYSFVQFNWIIYSEQQSSQQADDLAGIVNAYFDNTGFAYPGILFKRIECLGLIGAIRASQQLWRAENQYWAMIEPH